MEIRMIDTSQMWWYMSNVGQTQLLVINQLDDTVFTKAGKPSEKDTLWKGEEKNQDFCFERWFSVDEITYKV